MSLARFGHFRLLTVSPSGEARQLHVRLWEAHEVAEDVRGQRSEQRTRAQEEESRVESEQRRVCELHGCACREKSVFCVRESATGLTRGEQGALCSSLSTAVAVEDLPCMMYVRCRGVSRINSCGSGEHTEPKEERSKENHLALRSARHVVHGKRTRAKYDLLRQRALRTRVSIENT